MDVMKRKVAWLTKNDLSMKVESSREKLQKLIMQAKSANRTLKIANRTLKIANRTLKIANQEAKKDEVPASFSASSSAQRSSVLAQVAWLRSSSTKVKKGLAAVSPLTG